MLERLTSILLFRYLEKFYKLKRSILRQLLIVLLVEDSVDDAEVDGPVDPLELLQGLDQSGGYRVAGLAEHLLLVDIVGLLAGASLGPKLNADAPLLAVPSLGGSLEDGDLAELDVGAVSPHGPGLAAQPGSDAPLVDADRHHGHCEGDKDAHAAVGHLRRDRQAVVDLG